MSARDRENELTPTRELTPNTRSNNIHCVPFKLAASARARRTGFALNMCAVFSMCVCTYVSCVAPRERDRQRPRQTDGEFLAVHCSVCMYSMYQNGFAILQIIITRGLCTYINRRAQSAFRNWLTMWRAPARCLPSDLLCITTFSYRIASSTIEYYVPRRRRRRQRRIGLFSCPTGTLSTCAYFDADADDHGLDLLCLHLRFVRAREIGLGNHRGRRVLLDFPRRKSEFKKSRQPARPVSTESGACGKVSQHTHEMHVAH